MLWISGGLADPNLAALAQAAERLGVPWLDGRLPPASSPLFHWSLEDDASDMPWGDGPAPTACFHRHDVFGPMDDPRPVVSERATGWTAAIEGWLLAHPEVRTLNADIRPVAYNKPAALLRARAAGLRTPPTWVSNDVARLRARLARPSIAKPVAGGGHCQTLEEALGPLAPELACSAKPALIQPRLAPAECRVFAVGSALFAFDVASPSLDYRVHQDAEVTATEVPACAPALQRLLADFGMDFGAADFKADPDTGEWVFLELNTSPMFVRFDQACEGRLTEAMVRHLTAAQRPSLAASSS
ncbi:MAG: hypothetical protein RI907_199 [Pseudomonadota bacterium]|jgi:hypothetical protein